MRRLQRCYNCKKSSSAVFEDALTFSLCSDLPPKVAHVAIEMLVNLLLANPSAAPDTLSCGALRPLVELGLLPSSPALALRVIDVLASALQIEPQSVCTWPVDVFRHLAVLVAADRNL
jgi:hypothetical protein